MNISEYRYQFASFNSSLELARYKHHVGLTSAVNRHEIFDRYSDLFSLESIRELRALLELTPADFGTERKALHSLLGAAQLRHVETQALELTEELARCEAGTSIQWKGEELSLESVQARLAREPKPQRGELGARWLDAISRCDELRRNRRAKTNESARVLGFASYCDLMSAATNMKADDAQQAARLLIEQTESEYRSALGKLIARELPDERLSDLDYADLPYLETASWLDRYLPAKNTLRTHAETARGMGIRMGRQLNVQVDIGPRPSRKSGAACFPVKPPEEVRLAVMASGGAAEFLKGHQQAGIAQYHAWCSKQLAVRHPEFVYSFDPATPAAFGYLFQYLALDPKWILEFLPEMESVRAGIIACDVAMQMTLDLRRLCAGVLFASSACDDDQSPEHLQSTYVHLYERATSFSMRPEPFLLNLENGTQPGRHLSALAFSFGLREYLRVRYGHRWWSSRKAGDELIDLWSTASQYSVEELASLIGFGEISFDLVAETINTTLSGA